MLMVNMKDKAVFIGSKSVVRICVGFEILRGLKLEVVG